jgi:hypothetical protein
MNHQPFRNWLLSEEELSAEQIQSLQEHLASCESCVQIKSSGKEMDALFQNLSQVSPAPGFTQRWQSHLAEYEARQRNRSGWFIIVITALIAAFLLILLANQVWPLIKNPGPFIAAWLNQLVGLISDYYILQTFFRTNVWLNPISILMGSVLLVGIICFMSVLWITAYQKFSLSRRIV